MNVVAGLVIGWFAGSAFVVALWALAWGFGYAAVKSTFARRQVAIWTAARLERLSRTPAPPMAGFSPWLLFAIGEFLTGWLTALLMGLASRFIRWIFE